MFDIFPYFFQSTFNSLINNRQLIDNIVDSVLNNETFNNMINDIENMMTLDLDFRETASEYMISGHLPGISKRDIDIDYNNNYITVNIKRNQFFSNGVNMSVAIIQQGGDLEKDYYVGNVDPYAIKAVFKNEFLQVIVPKKNKIDRDSTIIDVDSYTVK